MGCGATAGTNTHKPSPLKSIHNSKLKKSPSKYEAPLPRPKQNSKRVNSDVFTLF